MNTPRRTNTASRWIAVGVVFGLALLASALQGLPKTLPAVALDWGLLFHVQRAAALLGGIGVVLLVGWRATKGEFPIKFGQVEYAVKDAAARASEVQESHESRLQPLELLAGIRDQIDEEPEA